MRWTKWKLPTFCLFPTKMMFLDWSKIYSILQSFLVLHLPFEFVLTNMAQTFLESNQDYYYTSADYEYSGTCRPPFSLYERVGWDM